MKNKYFLLIPFFIFLGTRFFIIHGYNIYWTDVELYFNVAFAGIKGGYSAYHDIWWPYPPLTLLLVYLPILFFPDIGVLSKASIFEYFHSYILPYRTAFQYEMFIFEIITLVYLILFLKKRFDAENKKIGAAILLYSVLGLLTGHLLYDRLDIVITAVFMASAYHFTSPEDKLRDKYCSYLIYLAGALFKLLPLLWWPVYFISECFAESSEEKEGNGLLNKFSVSKKQLKRAFMPFLIIVIPFIIIMFTYNKMTYNQEKHKGMFTYMSEHGKRGIQMESTWATPMMICNAYKKSMDQTIPFPLVTNFGAQHFEESSINKIYLLLSKYAGFISLALIYIAVFFYFLKNKEERETVKDPKWILTFLLFAVFFIISTQRVLSSQYIIWPMAGIVVLIFTSKKPESLLLILTCLIFIFSHIGFDMGYEKYIKLDPWIVAAVSFRNLLLLVITILLFFRIIPKSRKD